MFYPLRNLTKIEEEMTENKPEIPSYGEWLANDFTQLVLRDIYDTLVKGAEKRPFYSYVTEVTQQKYERQKSAAFRHMLPCHELSNGNGHAIDKDSGKPHMANAAARAFLARGQQIELLNNLSVRNLKESIDE